VITIKKLILLITITLGIAGLLLFNRSLDTSVEASGYVLCHHNPAQSITLEFENQQAYDGHLGLPHNQQVYDTEGGCDIDETELPSMSAVEYCGFAQLEFSNPTRYFFSFDYRIDGEEGTDDEVTPSNIANGPFAGQPFGQRYNTVDVDGRNDEHFESVVVGFPEDSGDHVVDYRLWRGAENDWYLPWQTVGVKTDCEPNPTPTPEPEVKVEQGQPGTPQCTDTTPLVLPSNVHVIRAGADATVNFFTSSSNANLYYKEVSATDWQHAARDIPVTGGYVSYTIHDLNPNLGYTFGVQASNSCAGGETVVAVVVDGPQSVTFPLSFWEWLK